MNAPAATLSAHNLKKRYKARTVVEDVSFHVPVGEFLADQLLIPMAMARGGTFRTLPPSSHTTTNMQVIERFLPSLVLLAPAEIPTTVRLQSLGVVRLDEEQPAPESGPAVFNVRRPAASAAAAGAV